MKTPLHYLTLTETIECLKSGQVSSVDLVRHYVARIRALDDKLHGMITVAESQALERAERADTARKRGMPGGPLAGIPVVIKDSIPTQGIRTTANSRLLENWIPEHDAAAVAHLRAAGAIILGKTNLNEFGWAIPSQDDLVPTPQNPWNPKYASIGSSSGSGIAASVGYACAALGTDGGGSARLPGGQHGLIAIKATHGRVSRLHMDTVSISEISPLARSTADAALLLQVIAGHEPEDIQSVPLAVPAYADRLQTDLRGWRIGVPRKYVETAPVEAEVQKAFDAGLEVLARLGAEVVDLGIAGLAEARMTNFVVLNAESHTAHAVSLRTHPEKYGHSAYLYHWGGAFLSAADYLHAKEVGRQIRVIVQSKFDSVRAIALPTSPFVSSEAARQPGIHRTGIGACFTSPFNLTGHPAINIPCGMSNIGLPIGMQLIGSLFDEMSLLQVSFAYEQATEWHNMHPAM